MKKFLIILIVGMSVVGCTRITEDQTLRKSPCAGDPCSGNLPKLTNAAQV